MREVPETKRTFWLEYLLAVVIVGVVGTSVWAGLSWWELRQARTDEASSAFRTALRDSSRDGSAGWQSGLTTGKSGGSASGNLPTLEMMLQGSVMGPLGSAPGEGAAPDIERSFDQINDVLQNR